MIGAQLILWAAVAVVLYTFAGFPVLVGWLARRLARPVLQADITPSLTLVIPAYNEAAIIKQKIANCLSLDYPRARLTIAFVTDGSTDGTPDILRRHADDRLLVFHQPERRGKIAAVNRVVPQLSTEIIVFSDANTMHPPHTLRALARNFADPRVAAVAGEKRVTGGGEGLYWRYESFLKRCDSALSSVMGAAGELFALRRAHFQPPPANAIIEDFVLSMRLVQAGHRVVYEPEAVAEEPPLESLRGEWARRTRIAAGGFQSIVWLRGLLHPRHGRVAWQYLSHRVLRWAVTPFLLPVILIVNLILVGLPAYRWLLAGQLLFYGLGAVGGVRAARGKKSGLAYTAFFFCFTNAAAIAGLWRYLTGKQSVLWEKTR